MLPSSEICQTSASTPENEQVPGLSYLSFIESRVLQVFLSNLHSTVDTSYAQILETMSTSDEEGTIATDITLVPINKVF